MSSEFASSVLMIRPKNFGFNPQTAASNAFQNQEIAIEDNINQKALQEFDNAVHQLRLNGIDVKVVDDTQEPAKPDAIFPNNWFSTHADGSLVIYPMLTPNRRTEVREDIINQLQHQFGYQNIVDFRKNYQLICEGTGSLIFDHKNKIVYASKSARTRPELVEEISKKLHYQPVIFEAVDEAGNDIYHTNVVMFLGPDFVVLCTDSVRAGKQELINRIKNSGKNIIDISYAQMNQFAGNGICVQNRDGKIFTILSESAFRSLDPDQYKAITKETEILQFNVSTIEKIGGGGIRCMIAELYEVTL